jgi:hypothetical protein
MYDFLALKRLSASDLTFFERLYRVVEAGNQKSINLNADVLTGRFYPNLGTIADAQPDGEISLTLTICGPTGAGLHRLKRKIVKGRAYKNWRLNGEFVHDPPGEPGRFDRLRAGDLAVIGFEGTVAPHAVGLGLIGAGIPEDAALHAALLPLVGTSSRTSMVELPMAALASALNAASVPNGHPLFGFTSDPLVALALEDVAQGGATGADILRRRTRPVTRAELAKAKASADRNGELGEDLVDRWLAGQEGAHEWASATNALSPFDFIRRHDGRTTYIEVKSTSGPFSGGFHISLAEVREAAGCADPYVIYRVHDLTDDGGMLRVSTDIRDVARRLLAAHDGALFGGIKADSFTIPIDTIAWEDGAIQLVLDEDDAGA